MSSSSSKKASSSSSSSSSNAAAAKKLKEVQDALAELQHAKDEIARLQRERELAVAQTKKALAEFEESDKYSKDLKKKLDGNLASVPAKDLEEAVKSESNKAAAVAQTQAPNYSSKHYWDLRYEEEANQLKAAKSNPNLPNNTDSVTLYEWYMSFEAMRTFLSRDVQKTTERLQYNSAQNCRVYVPGCGNSTLGEDILAIKGVGEVVASDFSAVLVAKMEERVREKGLHNVHYREGDVCALVGEDDESYDMILDKGTLDAISSNANPANSPDYEKQLKDNTDPISKYVSEMWRILRINGCFVVLTTMPLAVFQSLVLQRILYNWSDVSKDMVASFALLHQESMKADGGGEVFYYSLKKHRNLQTKKDYVMQGIHALLDEAKKAKLAQDWMASEQETAGLSGASGSSSVSNGPLERLLSIEDFSKEGGSAFAAILPKVELTVLYEQSQLQASGFVEVQFQLRGGSWDADDVLRLALHPTVGGVSSDDYSAYFFSDLACEGFEYVDSGKLETEDHTAKLYMGTLRVPLPAWTSTFHLSYLRDVTTLCPAAPHGNGSTATASGHKVYVKLQQSEAVSVKFPCYPYNPSVAKMAVSRQYPSRRGAVPITELVKRSWAAEKWSVVVEDMPTIQRLHLTVKPVGAANSMVGRVMCFAYPLVRVGEQDGVTLLLEVDVLHVGEHAPVSSVTLEYIPVHLSSQCLAWSQLEVGQVVGELDAQRQVCLRIPYQSKSGKKQWTNTNSVLQSVLMQDYQSLEKDFFPSAVSNTNDVMVECKFCGNEIMSPGQLKQLHALPTGLLDENMHEFICCEEVTCLTVEDMTFQPKACYLSSTYLIADAEQNTMTGCNYQCRESSSLLDLYTNIGSAMMTSAVPMPSTIRDGDQARFIHNAFRSIIGVDHASMKCKRCDSYLGDAKLRDDNEEHDDSDDDELSSDRLKSHFSSQEVQSVKLLSHKVNLKHSSGGGSRVLSLEQVVARLCVYVLEKVSLSTVCFFVGAEVEACIQAEKDIGVIVVRTLNKQCRLYRSVDAAEKEEVELRDCIKVMYKLGAAKDVVKGKEARVPLDAQDFMELRKLLLRKKAKQASVSAAGTDVYVDLLL